MQAGFLCDLRGKAFFSPYAVDDAARAREQFRFVPLRQLFTIRDSLEGSTIY